jgi:hypothetical protein
MTVVESSLYADLHVETSPVQATAVWTDHIASVRDIQVTRGGYEPYIGVNRTEPGSGTITLVDFDGTINPGYWIKLRYESTIFWAGYVENVGNTFRYIDGVTYKITTLYVLDWVGWISQFSFDNYPAASDPGARLVDINTLIDSTRANRPILESTLAAAGITYSSYPRQASVADMLDMLTNSMTRGYWKSQLAVPTGSTSGIDSIVRVGTTGTGYATYTFTDGTFTGTGYGPNQMNIIEIEVANNTSSVTNNVVLDTSFVKYGSLVDTEYRREDATSIGTYGSRLSNVVVNARGDLATNLITHPSFEDYDYQATASTFNTSVEQPSKSAISWSAKRGDNALRGYVTVAGATIITLTDQERINITAGNTYYAVGYAAVYSLTNAQARFRIDWYGDDGAIISTTFGSYTAISANRTWYKMTASGVAPAGAQRARVAVYHTRTSGTYGVGEKCWADALYFGGTNVTDSFDGDVADSSSYLYDWLGTPNASQSFRMDNVLYTIAGDILTDNKTAVYTPLRLRINAQDNLTAVKLIDLYLANYIYFQSTFWRTFITGLTHTININTDGTTRWMIDAIVRPSASTTPPPPPP